ncbi:MAG: hypothetical protein K9L84_04220 [Candidatus Omnitrophica bacterium]|nr:hypothetical protein [Candidatus Omnitrophota bacterium]MCF7894246.1 hypothetical protein [Candidatus Omnitrophota bacterium]
MSKKNLKIIGIILLALLIDILRPFDYFFLVNLTFLTIIILSFHNNLFFSLFTSLFAGFAQDTLVFSSNLFYTIEYPLIVIAVFLLNNFLKFIKTRHHPLIPKAIIAAFLILVHSFLNILRIGSGNFSFLTYFFIQSYLVFFLIDNILEKALKPKRYQLFNKKDYVI